MSTNFYWTAEGLALARALVDDAAACRPEGDEGHIGKRWAAGWYCEQCATWLEQSRACARCGTPYPATVSGPAAPDGPVFFACGFTWAQDPEVVGGICRRHPGALLITDEFDAVVRADDFLAKLSYVRRAVMDLVGVADWC